MATETIKGSAAARGTMTERASAVASANSAIGRARKGNWTFASTGKDQKKGWALPLLVHCLIHLAVALAMILIVAPRFWFVAFIDFAIHIVIDRCKGLCVSTFNVTMEHQWFWWLIGIDQALHHLTGFGLSIFMAAN